MKKQLWAAVAALTFIFAAVSATKAQTALFIYNDGSGTPNAGTYTPGSTFTFSINLAFAPGGSVVNLDGLSYWFQQSFPAMAPFPFSITLRDVRSVREIILATRDWRQSSFEPYVEERLERMRRLRIAARRAELESKLSEVNT